MIKTFLRLPLPCPESRPGLANAIEKGLIMNTIKVKIGDHKGFENAIDNGFTIWSITDDDYFVMKRIDTIIV